MAKPTALLRFYTDTHIAKAVAVQLRTRNVDIVRCEEVGLAEAADLTHLQYATAEGRAIITHDQDFLILAAKWQAEGQPHGGIFFVQQYLQGNVGQMVKRLMEYVELIEAGAGTVQDDIANQVTYIG